MDFRFKRLAAVLGLAALAFTPVPAGFDLIGTGAAYAKGGGGGNGNGGGNGGGSSHASSGKSSTAKGSGGNGGERTKAASGGASGSHKKKVASGAAPGGRKSPAGGSTKKMTTATAAPKKRPAAIETAALESEPLPKGNGALASELKGMNAVHASPNALANASPNSQVGRIATYQIAALATLAAAEVTQTAIADREAALGTLTGATDALAAYDTGYTGRSRTEIESAIVGLDPAAEDYVTQFDALNAELDAVATYESGREGLVTAETDAREKYDAALLAELDAANAAEEAAASEETALLAATGGRVLSDEALAYVRAELGLTGTGEEDSAEVPVTVE